MLRFAAVVFLGFPDTVAFLTYPVPAFTVPQRINNWVLVLGVAG